jgi:hypothetical protein
MDDIKLLVFRCQHLQTLPAADDIRNSSFWVGQNAAIPCPASLELLIWSLVRLLDCCRKRRGTYRCCVAYFPRVEVLN